MIAILADRVITPNAAGGVIEGPVGTIVLVDEATPSTPAHIVAVGLAGEMLKPAGAAVIDARGLTLAPGLIDVHTHGAAGAQAIDGTVEALRHMAQFYARHGVTGFLATIGGMRENIENGLRAAVEAAAQPFETGPTGHARLLGVHLEGPFLNPKRPGAFRPESIVPPDVALFEDYVRLANGLIKLVTLAPELPQGLDVVRAAQSHGILSSAGHSEASREVLLQAHPLGLRHVTHTFNAMPGLHHREAGLLSTALSHDEFSAEIIADGLHVQPDLVRLFARSKNVRERCAAVLITDSVAAAGMPDGTYTFEEQQVFVKEGAVRLENGTLAGSALTMDRGVANLVEFGAATLPEAIHMGSFHPAVALGLDHRYGRITAGGVADLIAIETDADADADADADDNLQRVAWTMVNGRVHTW